ncbi:MAG: hypothetical protein KAI53_03600 [Candidatus Aenigmarchaeota archaeon]|nr:hypothetical protein [Candidatus Aenigmarchaeota archaeon]
MKRFNKENIPATFFAIAMGVTIIGYTYLHSIGSTVLNTYIQNVGLLFLVMITGMYAYETEKMAKHSYEQIIIAQKQAKIANLEKQLEEVYSPLYSIIEIAKELYDANPSAEYLGEHGINGYAIRTEDYFRLSKIFEKYNHLIDTKIYNAWIAETTKNGEITAFRYGNVTKQTIRHYNLLKMHNLIVSKMNELKNEYKNLLNS